MDAILIQQLQIEALIGVYPNERQSPQPLAVDLELHFSQITHAAQSDHLTDTINYATVCQSVQQFIQRTQCQLIETLAEQIAQLLLTQFPISSCQITLYKKPFDLSNVQHVAVRIQRKRVAPALSKNKLFQQAPTI